MPVRRSVLALAAMTAVLCSLLVAPASAGTATDTTGEERPDPVTQGSDAAETALDNVRGLLDDALPDVRALPVPVVPDLAVEPVVDDATMALRDLALLKGELTGKDRAEAEAYLARPTDDPGPRNPDSAYSYEEALSSPACGGAVCVHYAVPTSKHAPSQTNTGGPHPDYVDTVLAETVRVHNIFVAAGYRAPKGDGGIGGGSNKTDIYLADIGDNRLYGYCTSDQRIPRGGPFDAWAYCVLDDDYAPHEFPTNTWLENLRVTIAHEYFHAVQFGYDIAEDSWFLEATAVWIEDEMFDTVDDNLQYLRRSPLSNPRVRMDTFGNSFHYGTWIFFRYLSERYPASKAGLPVIVRDMFRKADGARGRPDQYSIQAVKSVLKARKMPFPKLFAKFSNANRRPAQVYSEGRANRYRPAPLFKAMRLGKRQSKALSFRAHHLTSATVRLKPARGVRGANTKMRIRVQMAPAKRGSAAVASVKLKSGKFRVMPIRVRANGVGYKKVPFSRRTIRYVELTLANAGTNYSCFVGGPYSCQGFSKNDRVKESFRATVLGG